MTMTAEVADIFADARHLQASALERLAAGDVRDAAEKAWGATRRATDALLLAVTGSFPETSRQTSNRLRRLAASDERARSLMAIYERQQAFLHGECFYLGLCEPTEDLHAAIHAALTYVEEAEAIAAA